MTVAEVRSLSARELVRWQAYEDLYGGFDHRADRRAAVIATVIRNGLGSGNMRIEDFMSVIQNDDLLTQGEPMTKEQRLAQLHQMFGTAPKAD